MDIGHRMKELRIQYGLTQQELADAIGVSFQTISKWETAASMPDITLLPPLAEYFRVSTDQLLGLKPLDGEQGRRISGTIGWTICCGRGSVSGTTTMSVSSFHRYGISKSPFPYWTADADTVFWDCCSSLPCPGEAPTRELILRKI